MFHYHHDHDYHHHHHQQQQQQQCLLRRQQVVLVQSGLNLCRGTLRCGVPALKLILWAVRCSLLAVLVSRTMCICEVLSILQKYQIDTKQTNFPSSKCTIKNMHKNIKLQTFPITTCLPLYTQIISN